MNKPLLAAIAAVVVGGTIATYVVASPGGDEEVVQVVETPIATAMAEATANPSATCISDGGPETICQCPNGPRPFQPEIPLASPGPRDPSQVGGPDVVIPILTEAQIATATQILATDSRAQMLMADLPYSIRETSVWVTADYDIQGVGLDISLAAPVSPTAMIGDWIAREHDPSSSAGYREAVFSITPEYLANFTRDSLVQRFVVTVDLESGRLVDLYPLIQLPLELATPPPQCSGTLR